MTDLYFGGSMVRQAVVEVQAEQLLENMADFFWGWEKLYGDAGPERSVDRYGDILWEYRNHAGLRDFLGGTTPPECLETRVEDCHREMVQDYVRDKFGDDFKEVIDDVDDVQSFCEQIWRYDWCGPDEVPDDPQLMLPGFDAIPPTPWYESDCYKAVEAWEQSYMEGIDETYVYFIKIELDVDNNVIDFRAGIDADCVVHKIPLKKLTKHTFAALEKLTKKFFANA